MDIICPSHGMFKQSSSSHLSKHGCPRCKISRGEKKIEKELIELKIEYISEKTFDGLKSSKNQHLRFDFYLPAINTCIEYDGKQHFESNEYLRGKVGFVDRKLRDNIKNIYCDNNNIKLVRIPYYEFDNIEKIIKQI
jgi:very-short-patch-repair endonuclease